jgi:hypothetical protein
MDRSSILLEKLHEFYDVEENYTQMVNIIEKNKVSLRIIEWYITIYAKNYNIQLHCDYKNKLKGLQKSNFDPYCRKYKIVQNEKHNIAFDFQTAHGTCYTTVAQLNFCKWLIENKIIDYIYNDYSALYKEFKEYETKDKVKVT